MRQWLSSVLKTVLAQKLSLLLTVSWVPILTVAISARDYLAQFVPQPAEQWAVLTTASSLAGMLTAAATYFWFRPKFVEHRGAFFKRNPAGGYHDAVYCGVCKKPTATGSYHVASNFKCSCGWQSEFTKGDLPYAIKKLH